MDGSGDGKCTRDGALATQASDIKVEFQGSPVVTELPEDGLKVTLRYSSHEDTADGRLGIDVDVEPL